MPEVMSHKSLKSIEKTTLRHVVVLAIAGLLATSPLAATAQGPTPDEIQRAAQRAEQLQREEQLRQQQQFQSDRESARPPATIEVPQAQSDTQLPADALCLPVQKVQLNGVTLLSADALAPVLQRYEQRCVGVAEIEKLLGELTLMYVQKGYIAARVYLPEQDLTTGTLQLQALEGVVEKLQLEDGGRSSIRFGNVLPFVVGKPLNLRDFEQALDQINRLQSNNARFDLRPGSKPGDSVVVITNEPRRRWQPSLSYDNQGSESTGRYQLGANFSFDRPLGINDFISLTHRRSLPYDESRKASQSSSVSYVVPFGYSTFSLNYSDSSYYSALKATSGSDLLTSGDSNTGSLRADHLLFRNQSTRGGVYGTVTRKDSKNYLEGVLIGVSSRTLSVADVGANYSTSLGGGAVNVDVGYTRGLSILGATEDPSSLPATAPRAQYDAYKFGGGYQYPFAFGGLRWQFSSQLSGQYAPKPLYGSEQILIGGIYTVRGFLRNTLSGDSGYFVRNDLGVTVPVKFGSARPYIAFDYGDVSTHIAGVPEGDLAGAALGLAYNTKHLRADVFYAHDVIRPNSMPSEDGVANFRLSLSL